MDPNCFLKDVPTFLNRNLVMTLRDFFENLNSKFGKLNLNISWHYIKYRIYAYERHYNPLLISNRSRV